MKRFSRWAALLVLVLLGLAVVALTRPTPPYAGRVLYLHLRLAPYMVPGTSKEIQYWIDAAAGRIRYAEMVPQSGTVQSSVNGVPVQPSPPQWFVIALARQPSGTCAVAYTNLLDSSERTQPIRCAALLAMRDVKALRARALALWHRHRAAATTTGPDHVTVSVPVSAGTELVPILTEDPSISPGERMAPGTLLLDRRTGLPYKHQRLSAGQSLDHDRAHPQRPTIGAGYSPRQFVHCAAVLLARSRAGLVSLAARRAALPFLGCAPMGGGGSVTSYRAIMMGFGNVGRAVATLFLQRGAAVERDHGVAVRFVLVADRSGAAVDPAGLDLQRLLDVKARMGGVAAYPGGGQPGLGGAAAIASLTADLLLEASPTAVRTGEPGLAHIRAALSRGMHVVTANKGPLVVAIRDLLRLAHERGVELRYAGTVAAPTPALELARYALHGAVVESIEAVPNATTNYILTLMEAGHALEDGIRAAQAAGIAETDPALDLGGWDSAAKIIILAHAVMGGDLRLDDVDVEGISAVTTAHLTQARRQSCALKLLANVWRGPRGLHAAVAPTPLPMEHPLARLCNTAMGVLFHTDLLGDLLISVEGDSPLGTAQAMLRDVVNIGREHRASS